MALHRIYGIILRYILLARRSFDRLFDLFYWPTIDLTLWGLTGYYLEKLAPNATMIVLMIVSGVVFWLIVWRGQNDIGVSLLEDLWNKNMINIFVSPLTFIEWTVSLIILGVIKVIISLPFAMLVSFILYKVNFLHYGFSLIPFMLLLLISGWWVGCLVSSIILRFGSRVQVLAWSLVYLLAPFSAIYYPLSVLPHWAQIIGSILPTTYIFEGARQVIQTGILDWSKIFISLALNIIYLIISFALLKRSFNKVLERGLVKLF